jgi:hypothetical protein
MSYFFIPYGKVDIDKVTSIKYHMVLRDFEDVFREIS